MLSLIFWGELWQSLQMYMMHLSRMCLEGMGGSNPPLELSVAFCCFIPNDILTGVLEELLLGDTSKLSLLR